MARPAPFPGIDWTGVVVRLVRSAAGGQLDCGHAAYPDQYLVYLDEDWLVCQDCWDRWDYRSGGVLVWEPPDTPVP